VTKRSTRRKAKQREVKAEPIVNAFAARHGDYGFESMPVGPGELDGERAGNVAVMRNRGGTTVERWLTAGILDKRQAEVITIYARAWRKVFAEQRVTANWSLVSFIRGIPAEQSILGIAEANEILDRFDEKFRRLPPHYKSTWQDIVIFDNTLYRIGTASRSTADRAKLTCMFVADLMAAELRI
jgi:hypothetical protein